ncbi:hypothetical protein ACTVZO_44010 [Streptomyces sp. IBSNAI002]|uniref:hypothetical protein n=1 Tax=Streptomyces sp. IBSNAI002 TaxID=3457500 RepID=UPI003FD2DA68
MNTTGEAAPAASARPTKRRYRRVTPERIVIGSGEERRSYQVLAEHLLQNLRRKRSAAVPLPQEIARRYCVPVATAQFVRRAAVTRLRPPLPPLPQPTRPPRRPAVRKKNATPARGNGGDLPATGVAHEEL